MVGSTLPASRVNGPQAMSLPEPLRGPHCGEIYYNAPDEASDGYATKRPLKFADMRTFLEIEPLAMTAEFVRRSRVSIARRAVAPRTSPATSDFATEGTGS